VTPSSAVPWIYAAASVVSFVAYGVDKRAAAAGRSRTRESTLHLIDAAGGWPGALVAQRVFHHKTRKIGFQIVFWLTVAAHCAALAWWASTH
jgi:uncharacterized membrane protein YsdA (DUF1294 family)